MSKSVESIITDRIVEEMEKGVVAWHRPWFGVVDGPISHSTGKPYSLLNQALLHGEPSEFITFKQATAEGGCPRKGSSSHIVTFWKRLTVETGETDADGNPKTRTIPMLRYYQVFDIKECDGITAKYPDREATRHEPSAEGEAVVGGYFGQPDAPHLCRDKASNSAFYSPSLDAVTVPMMEQFADLEDFYSTLFHEMVHSTGHASRLNRFRPEDHFGSDGYSKEELVAEIGAAALLHRIGLETPESFRDSASYIQGWSESLRKDPRLFVTACSRAEKAVNWILNGGAEKASA